MAQAAIDRKAKAAAASFPEAPAGWEEVRSPRDTRATCLVIRYMSAHPLMPVTLASASTAPRPRRRLPQEKDKLVRVDIFIDLAVRVGEDKCGTHPPT